MNIYILNNSSKHWPLILFLLVLSFLLVIDFPVADTPNLFSVRNAEARLGRPASPNSVAGAHRRTKKRTARRVAAGTRVHALPAGCTTVMKRGVKYHSCGGVYYRPYYEGNTVGYVVESP